MISRSLDHVRFRRGDLWYGDAPSLLWNESIEPSSFERLYKPKSIALAYFDPPFFSQANYAFQSPGHPFDGELAFSDTLTMEKWRNLIVNLFAALEPWMRRDGSIVVHLDSRTTHWVRCDIERYRMLPFASEIIWHYRRWPSKTPNFQRVHDTLLRYRVAHGGKPIWNQLYEPPSASTLKTWGTKRQNAVVASGRRLRSSTGEEESRGVPMGDVWSVPILAPMSKERTGYPTQKPMNLLKRLISATTNPGDIVIDPMCGSGTTLQAARDLGRRYIGIDSSPVAFQVASNRLRTARISG